MPHKSETAQKPLKGEDAFGDFRGLWREDEAPKIAAVEAKIAKARKRTNFAIMLEVLVILVSVGFALYWWLVSKPEIGLPLLIYIGFAAIVSAVQRRHGWRVYTAPVTDTIEALDGLERGRLFEAYACLVVGVGMVAFFGYIHVTYKPLDALGGGIATFFLGGSWVWAIRQIRSARKRRASLAKMKGAVRSIPS